MRKCTTNNLNLDKISSNVRSISNYDAAFVRTQAPVRGAFRKYDAGRVIAMWHNISDKYFRWIKLMYQKNRISSDAYNSLLTFEKYQSDQKGPAAPLDDNPFSYSLDSLSDIELPVDQKHVIEFYEAYDKISAYYQVKKTNYDFYQSWDNLPKSTLRGYPYFNKGSVVDKDIKSIYGNTLSGALMCEVERNNIVTVPGFRVQGKANPPAKLRIIFIVDVGFQYFITPFVESAQNQLKKYPSFCGWLKLDEQRQVIKKALDRAKSINRTIISMDYSQFDKRIIPAFRKKSTGYYLSKFLPSSIVEKFVSKYDDQRFYYKVGKNLVYKSVPNQLLSGMKNTQLDGTLINLAVQNYICTKLGFEMDFDTSFALGDDTGLSVPNSLLEEIGYDELNIRISQILEEIGMIVNANKAYPTTDFIFLQRLYNDHYIGQGSWIRNIASFFFSENFSRIIPGVKWPRGMDIISQISIMTNPMSNTIIDEFASEFVQFWITHDDSLATLIRLNRERNGNEDSFFSLLIRATFSDLDTLYEVLNIRSYDPRQIRFNVQNGEYRKAFPILSYIIRAQVPHGSEDKDLISLINRDNLLSESERDLNHGDDDSLFTDESY